MDKQKVKQNFIILTYEKLELLSKEELIKCVLRLQKYIIELQKQDELLIVRMEELERRIGMNSQNSSMPPSSDPPYLQSPKKKSTGRNPGGQPGHKGFFRQLLPIEKVNNVIVLKPSVCKNCKQRLKGDDLTPHRHQVWEIPEIQPRVTEYQLHTLVCKRCGEYSEAKLPEGVPSGSFGPRVQAIVAICTGIYHMSKRTVKGMMEDIFNLPIGLGSISACESIVSEALAEPVEEVKKYIQEQKVMHVDETGYKEKNQKVWLWTEVTKLATLFRIHVSRGQKAAQEFIENFAGVLVSDRLSAYNIYKGMRQLCWAHLKRDFEGFTEYKERVGEISEKLLSKVDALFYWWHRVRDGTLNLQTFRHNMEWLQIEVEKLLLEGTICGNKKMERFCKRILKQKDYLWTFVNIEGVEPTNNIAERALRPAVLWRKRSFGTQSVQGSEFVCRIMAIGATCKQQGRDCCRLYHF